MAILPNRKSLRAERRGQRRSEVDADARLREGRSEFEGKVENLSAGGAGFLTCDTGSLLAIGTIVTLLLPGAGKGGAVLELAGRIVRAEELCDGSGDFHSYGIRFDQPLET